MNLRLRKSIRQILLAGSTAAFAAGALAALGVQNPPPGPGQVPDYFGVVPNYANSPQPILTQVAITGDGTGAQAVATTYDYLTDTMTDKIMDVQMLNGGSGYTNATAVVTDGGGASVNLTPIINNGVITGFSEIPNANNPIPGFSGLASTSASTFKMPFANTGIRKFVDSLPSLNTANNLGQSLPVATATALPDGSDYYVIAEREYTQKMHTDLPATHLRGYIQLDPTTGQDIGTIQYLGPIIVAQKDRPVRIKLVNQLSTGTNGNLPLPVDHTYMGSTNETDNRTAMHLHGGNTPWISDGTPRQWVKPAGEVGNNRGESARNVPDMWFDVSGNLIQSCTGQTSCTDPNATNDAGPGTLTFYYTNEQSARLMFYHDHAEGITRLNVYAGMAAGYILQDPTEQGLIYDANTNPTGLLPSDQIPLIIQEKTFVPDNTQPVLNFYGPFSSALNSQDPTWNWGSGTPAPTNGLNGNGDLWVPHVFMPNQNPGDPSGANAVGRWDYGPWFWPPFVGIQNGPIANPYYDPLCNATTGVNVNPLLGTCEGEFIPGVPNGASNVNQGNPALSEPSGTPESFNDTMTVNGTVYPYMEVEPKKYRLRILSVGNDRHLNLSMVVASSKNTDTTADSNLGPTNATALSNTCDGAHLGSVAAAECTEVRMVPWNSTQNKAANTPFPSWWYSFQKTGVTFDGRPSGVFSPQVRGPAMVQIGTEGGFLSSPTVIKNQPINYEYNVKNIVVGNVKEHALLLGPAERADVVVDFSQFAGSTIILYNDAPAALPAGDLRLDYYTGDYDNTDTGGAFSTLPGYGPNTRTVMQFRVADACSTSGVTNCGTGINRTPTSAHPVDDVDQSHLTALTSAVRNAFKTSQEPIIVPQSAYNSVYGTNVSDLLGTNLSSISGSEFTYGPLNLDTNGIATGLLDPAVTLTFQPKSIIEDWTVDYGRMNAMLGVEMPHTTAINQTSIPQGYIDPATELVKISQNGVPISGQMADGTQIWKITHNGVDTHPVHFHLFHVQLVNRVGWDGAVTNPQPNELGWKDTVRMNPLEDVIVALRPKTLTLPFKLGNNHRVMDPSNPGPDINTAMSFNFSPISGQASNVTNDKVANFGWEYAWHCHILGHEENDFMRPISVAHAPENPTAISAVGDSTSVTLNWKDNSVVSNWVQIQRDTVNTFDSPNLATFNVPQPECAEQAGCDRSYNDTNAPAATTVYYRVQSNNTVGMGNGILENGYNPDGTYAATLPVELASLTPGFTGYSNATANSDWSGAVVREVQPVAQVTAGPLSFGDQLINTESAAQQVTVTNTGNGNLAINSVALTANTDFVLTNNCPASLAPTLNCTIDVVFKPTVIGALSDTLSISSNASNGSPQTVQLSGTGTAPLVSLDKATLNLGNINVGKSTSAQTVTLTNTGTAPLTIGNIAASAPFAVAGGTCGTVSPVPVNGSCTIDVNFTPTATGAANGTLIITDNANGISGSTQQVDLSGNGTQPIAALTPASVDFGDVILGQTSATQTVTLTNSGDGPLTITTIATASPFAVITGGSCADGGQVAANGGFCTIDVNFTPTVGGSVSGVLTVTDDSGNVANTTQTVILSGVGAVPVAQVSAPLIFGDVDVASTSATQSVTLSNSGNAPLIITNMTISGQFAIAAGGTCATAIPVGAGGNCTINVTFSPTSAGAKTGTLTITDNSNGIAGSTQTVTVSGNGIVIPPAAPSVTAIERTSATVARVSWLDNSVNEASFQVQTSSNGGTSWNTVATSTSSVAQQSGTGARSINVNVSSTTNAIYRVVAVRRTPPTPVITVPSVNTVSLNNTVTPSSPAITTWTTQALSATAANVTINWQDNANNNASYRIDRCLRSAANANCTATASTWTNIGNLAGDAVTWQSQTQQRARPYTYRITASNGALTAATSVDITTP